MEKQKIAVINNFSSLGGWRWCCCVFGAILKYYPTVSITIFYNRRDKISSNVLDDLRRLGIKLSPQFYLFDVKSTNFIKNLLKLFIFRTFFFKKRLVKKINTFDFVINTWPFTTSAVKFSCPCFFIPHDFIFTHYFGHHFGNFYNRNRFEETKSRLEQYLDIGYIPCVGTKYISDELKNTFPNYSGPIHIIYIIFSVINSTTLTSNIIKNCLNKYDIRDDYILLATNEMHHKNTEEALTAFYYVKQEVPNLKLIITTINDVYVKMNSPFYADHVNFNEDYDIKSLGFVSSDELIVLIKKAKLVLNVSLCEAACGSGSDAWFIGTPTAISNIPPYVEQVKKLGVETVFFNPKNAKDIAEKILYLINNPDKANTNALISKKAINTNYTEKNMASEFINMFEQYTEENCR